MGREVRSQLVADTKVILHHTIVPKLSPNSIPLPSVSMTLFRIVILVRNGASRTQTYDWKTLTGTKPFVVVIHRRVLILGNV